MTQTDKTGKTDKTDKTGKSGKSDKTDKTGKTNCEKRQRVVLNISGEIFETYEDTLTRFPETLLGEQNRNRYYCSTTRQHFFDCNRLCFPSILYFFQSKGTLICPQGVPINIFETECRYFQLPEGTINRMKRDEGIIFDLGSDKIMTKQLPWQVQMWNVLENPESSMAAWIFGIISLTVTWLSIVTASLETIPGLQFQPRKDCVGRVVCGYWCVAEVLINTWFLIEFCLRLIFSQDKSDFFRATINWVDIFAVVPYFVLLILRTKQTGLMGIFKTLRFIRVVKLFRLSKHSRRLKVVGIILKSSLGNFRLLMLCLVMLIFIGGTFMYYAEAYDKQTAFTSIPESLWWAVQTITSVGYGDIIPSTLVGRTFACCFMLFGAVTISLPVLTIVSQFTTLYPRNVEYDSYTDNSL